MALRTLWVRRFVALSLLLLIIVGVPVWLVNPILDARNELDRALAGTRSSLKELHQTIAALDGESEGERLTEDARKRLFLDAKTAGLAGAALQERITKFVQGNGGTVTSLQLFEPLSVKERLSQVSIRVAFTSGNEDLVAIVRDIERAEPALFIDKLEVQSRATPANDAGGKSDTNLSLSLVVSAYMLGPES